MANVLFIGDMHFGHKNIQKFRKHVISEEDNREQIKAEWVKWVTKRDLVYVLGDALFDARYIADLLDLPGRKILLRGNHDQLPLVVYSKIFEEVHGIIKYKEFWLSHAPIHPLELRGKYNIHGHVHYGTIPDSRYVNVSVENLLSTFGTQLVSLDQIRKSLL